MIPPDAPLSPPNRCAAVARVALLRKGHGMITWSEDLQEGFQQLGLSTQLCSLRPETVSERLTQTQTLAEFAPELVVVLNFAGLPAAFADALRRSLPHGTRVVGWLCDRITEFPSDLEPCLDAVYYFDSACLPALQAAYGMTHPELHFLPLAASPSRYPNHHRPAHARLPRMVFAGNCTPDRHAVFAECRKLGLPLDVFGPHAGNFPRCWRNRKFSPSALAKLYQDYAVNLNLLQPGNTTDGLNLRAFEIPCTGGLATYPLVADLPRCFTPGSEVLAYQSLTELAELTRHAIAHPDEAAAIAAAGHARVMREHTFRHRAERLIADCRHQPTSPCAPPPPHALPTAFS